MGKGILGAWAENRGDHESPLIGCAYYGWHVLPDGQKRYMLRARHFFPDEVTSRAQDLCDVAVMVYEMLVEEVKVVRGGSDMRLIGVWSELAEKHKLDVVGFVYYGCKDPGDGDGRIGLHDDYIVGAEMTLRMLHLHRVCAAVSEALRDDVEMVFEGKDACSQSGCML